MANPPPAERPDAPAAATRLSSEVREQDLLRELRELSGRDRVADAVAEDRPAKKGPKT